MSIKRGTLVCVGSGITLGKHLTANAKSNIMQADVVITGVATEIMEEWIKSLNPKVKSLQQFYAEGKPRTESYKEMVEYILSYVRQGLDVCAVFYGHPGVFTWASHKSIETARKEGYKAIMEPGISAEDCLYADLAIDPGANGLQQYEATQFFSNKKIIDPSSYLILWQIGMFGKESIDKYRGNNDKLYLLIDYLQEYFPSNHEVIVYEAVTMAFASIRQERVRLDQLNEVELTQVSTLVIPPCQNQ